MLSCFIDYISRVLISGYGRAGNYSLSIMPGTRLNNQASVLLLSCFYSLVSTLLFSYIIVTSFASLQYSILSLVAFVHFEPTLSTGAQTRSFLNSFFIHFYCHCASDYGGNQQRCQQLSHKRFALHGDSVAISGP